MKHKFPYRWTLKDANFTKDKGTVFSCFACGGGSTMGYKLAGFDVIGCNEIDPKMMEVYRLNHNPKYSYLMPIQEFKDLPDLPEELFDLDILDGSPPCSSFSMAGNREKDWGKEKKFREGQAKQVLDTLFFDFIDLAKRLQPKVVIAENVKGILQGGAKKYIKEIRRQIEDAGYYMRYWLLDASKMGVPQRRERVFFIAIRRDIAGPFCGGLFGDVPELDLEFREREIPFGRVVLKKHKRRKIKPGNIKHWNSAKHNGRSFKTKNKTKTSFFYKSMNNLVLATITAGGTEYSIQDSPHRLLDIEFLICSTFPHDFNLQQKSAQYICGMSVPPVMTAQIASRVWEQWLSKIK